MKKLDRKRMLTLILVLLILALMAVVGYILWQEYQYGVSDAYYDSLRNTGLVRSVWKL